MTELTWEEAVTGVSHAEETLHFKLFHLLTEKSERATSIGKAKNVMSPQVWIGCPRERFLAKTSGTVPSFSPGVP